ETRHEPFGVRRVRAGRVGGRANQRHQGQETCDEWDARGHGRHSRRLAKWRSAAVKNEKAMTVAGNHAVYVIDQETVVGENPKISRDRTGVTAVTRSHRFCVGLGLGVVVCGASVFAAEPDLTGYRTVETAITIRAAKPGATAAARPGFLGLLVAANAQGRLAIAEVAANSPAAKAGVRVGDLLLSLNGATVTDAFTSSVRKANR